MAESTTTVTVKDYEWTQIASAGVQVLATPVIPGYSFLVRYSATNPGSDVRTGHKFFAKDDIPNAIIGSTNTEAIWMRLVNGDDQQIEVTAL